MKEIKCRAWAGGYFVYKNILGTRWLDDKGGVFYPRYGLILEPEQFTGWKDCNGVEIYEGDILQDGEGIQLVVFDEARAAFMLSESGSMDDMPSESVVFGNIHKNPELLEA